jgi:hypothetical protein
VKKKNDNRFADKMVELFHTKKMTYAMLSNKLKLKGFEYTPSQLFSIACHGTKADKELQEAIADILGCLRRDIF